MTEKNLAEKFEQYLTIICRIESNSTWIEPISFRQKNCAHTTYLPTLIPFNDDVFKIAQFFTRQITRDNEVI